MGPETPITHTKFQGNRSIGSREEDFLNDFTIYGYGSHICHVTELIFITFHFLVPIKAFLWNWLQMARWFLRKTSFNFHIWMTLGQGQGKTLTLNTHVVSFPASLCGSVGCAVQLETRRSWVQPPPRSATFFRGDWSLNIFYGHSLPSADSRRAVVSFWRKNVHNTG